MIEYNYTVNSDNSITIEWLENRFYQKNHPKTRHAWTKEEAESWALKYIQYCKDNNNEFVLPEQVTE
jgi:hypothetical protein